MWFGEPHLFPERDHLPDWARRDNKVTKGDRVEYGSDGDPIRDTIQNTLGLSNESRQMRNAHPRTSSHLSCVYDSYLVISVQNNEVPFPPFLTNYLVIQFKTELHFLLHAQSSYIVTALTHLSHDKMDVHVQNENHEGQNFWNIKLFCLYRKFQFSLLLCFIYLRFHLMALPILRL